MTLQGNRFILNFVKEVQELKPSRSYIDQRQELRNILWGQKQSPLIELSEDKMVCIAGLAREIPVKWSRGRELDNHLATVHITVRDTLLRAQAQALAPADSDCFSDVAYGIIENSEDAEKSTCNLEVVAELTAKIISNWEVVLYRAVEGDKNEKLSNTLLHPASNCQDDITRRIILETASAVMEVSGWFLHFPAKTTSKEVFTKIDRSAVINLISRYGPDFGQKWMNGQAIKDWLETEYGSPELNRHPETAKQNGEPTFEAEIDRIKQEIEELLKVFDPTLRIALAEGKITHTKLRNIKERYLALSDQRLASELGWDINQVKNLFSSTVKKSLARNKDPLAVARQYARNFTEILLDTNIMRELGWSPEEVKKHFTESVKKRLATTETNPIEALRQIKYNVEEVLSDQSLANYLRRPVEEVRVNFPDSLRRRFAVYNKSFPLDAALSYFQKLEALSDSAIAARLGWTTEQVQSSFSLLIKQQFAKGNKDPLLAIEKAVELFQCLPAEIPLELRWELARKKPAKALLLARHILELAGNKQSYPDFDGQLSENERIWILSKTSDPATYRQYALGRIIWYNISQYRAGGSVDQEITTRLIESGDELPVFDFKNINSATRAFLLRLARQAAISEEELSYVFNEIISGESLSQSSLVFLSRLRSAATATSRLPKESRYVDQREAIRSLLFEDETGSRFPSAASLARRGNYRTHFIPTKELKEHLGSVRTFVRKTLLRAQNESAKNPDTSEDLVFFILEHYSDSQESNGYLDLVTELTADVISVWEAAIYRRKAKGKSDKLTGFLLSSRSRHFDTTSRRRIVLETASAVMEVAGLMLSIEPRKNLTTLSTADKKALVKLVSLCGPDFGQEWISGRKIRQWLEAEYGIYDMKQQLDAAVGDEKRALEEALFKARMEIDQWLQVFSYSQRKKLLARKSFNKSAYSLVSQIKGALETVLADDNLASLLNWKTEQVQSIFTQRRKLLISLYSHDPAQSVLNMVESFHQLPAELDIRLRWEIIIVTPRQALARANHILSLLKDEKSFPSFKGQLSPELRQWFIFNTSGDPVKYQIKARGYLNWQNKMKPVHYDTPYYGTKKTRSETISDVVLSPETILFGEESSHSRELLSRLTEKAGISAKELDQLLYELQMEQVLSPSGQEILERLQLAAESDTAQA